METVCIFGPIHIYGDDYLPIYKELLKVLEQDFEQVYGTWPDFWDTDETPEEFYRRSIKTVKRTDVFLAEVTKPSLGVGMELQVTAEKNVPVVAMAQKGEKISSMVEGLPNLVKVIRYKDQEELIQKAEETVSEMKND